MSRNAHYIEHLCKLSLNIMVVKVYTTFGLSLLHM